MAASTSDESRDGVKLTNLDQPLFDGAGVDKRQLVDYLDAISDRIIPVLRNRPLSVIRATNGQAPFMQKNVPKYTPDFVATVDVWAEASHRNVSYAKATPSQSQSQSKTGQHSLTVPPSSRPAIQRSPRRPPSVPGRPGATDCPQSPTPKTDVSDCPQSPTPAVPRAPTPWTPLIRA